MRIATWNVERLKHRNELDAIHKACDAARADILVLTEADARVAPDYRFCYRTSSLKGVEVPILYRGEIVPVRYADTENRVSIFTNYRCLKAYATFDRFTAVCVELETELGSLLVYGTIIGVFGNREASFQPDLERQMEDIRRLSGEGRNVCLAGDYNLSFADNYYHTTLGRETAQNALRCAGISILTAERSACIDHIAISDSFMAGHRVTDIEEWNIDKTLSDHKGIMIGPVQRFL